MDAKTKLKKTQINVIKQVLEDVWNSANPESHHCLSVDNYIMLKSNKNPTNTRVSVRKIRKPREKPFISLPEHIQTEMKAITEKYDLCKRDIQYIKKYVETSEFKLLEATEQLRQFEAKVSETKFKSDQESLINEFEKRYIAFNQSLNDDLLTISPEGKADIHYALAQLGSLIEEFQEKLSEG